MEARSKTVMVVSAADGCWTFSVDCCTTQSEGAVGAPIRLKLSDVHVERSNEAQGCVNENSKQFNLE